MLKQTPPLPLLTVENAHFGYRNNAVLKGVSLGLYPGEILVLLGPNGAGKSTLVNALFGRFKLQKGRVLLGNAEPHASGAARRLAGYVPQDLAIYDKLTPLENFHAFGMLMGLGKDAIRGRANMLIKRLGLTERVKQRVGTFSGGYKRRVNIGAALMHAPSLLVLDEPTVGIDFKAKEELGDLLRSMRAEGLSILLTTHDMEEAEALADRVAIMVDGRIRVIGRPDFLVQQVFGGRQEVTISFSRHYMSHMSREDVAGLNNVGLFQYGNGPVFTGLINTQEDHISHLLNHFMTTSYGVQEIKVRDPGLKLLFDYFLQNRDGSGEDS